MLWLICLLKVCHSLSLDRKEPSNPSCFIDVEKVNNSKRKLLQSYDYHVVEIENKKKKIKEINEQVKKLNKMITDEEAELEGLGTQKKKDMEDFVNLSVVDKYASNMMCSVCFDQFKIIYANSTNENDCAHLYCKACADRIIADTQTCALCKEKFTHYKKMLALNQINDDIFDIADRFDLKTYIPDEQPIQKRLNFGLGFEDDSDSDDFMSLHE